MQYSSRCLLVELTFLNQAVDLMSLGTHCFQPQLSLRRSECARLRLVRIVSRQRFYAPPIIGHQAGHDRRYTIGYFAFVGNLLLHFLQSLDCSLRRKNPCIPLLCLS